MKPRKFPALRKSLLLLGDVILILYTYALNYIMYHHSLSFEDSIYSALNTLLCFILAYVVLLSVNNLYDLAYKRFADIILGMMVTSILAWVGLLFTNYIFMDSAFSRRFLLSFVIMQFILLTGWRFLLWRVEGSLHKSEREVLIVGNEEECAHIYSRMNLQPQMNLHLKLVSHDVRNVDWQSSIEQVDVVIIGDGLGRKDKENIIGYCHNHNKEVWFAFSLYELFCSQASIERIDDFPVLVPRAVTPNIETRIIKRIFDIVFSLAVLVILSPLFALVSICIKISDGGDVFYRQARVGRWGRTFDILKFRTMVVNAEKNTGPIMVGDNDERITRLGHFLRLTHIDELPTFVNVLRSEMSVVGPNAERPFFAKNYETTVPGYSFRYNVKPGVTGTAQVYGFYTTTPQDKLVYDLNYIQNCSLREDIVIIIQTIRTLFAINRLAERKPTIATVDLTAYSLETDTDFSDVPALDFSVLMSVYAKDNPVHFRQAVDSVINQSCPPKEILIVQDGSLTPELYAVCYDLQNDHGDLIRYLSLQENSGLGIALQKGVPACRYDLIARMDSDDIAKPNRFALQLREFRRQPELAVCGGYIEEFSDNPERIQSLRKVPLSEQEIYAYAKKRCPFNHMTVMFRRQAVLAVGNYQPFMLLEDYHLWHRLVFNGYHTKNIPAVLVSVRTGEGMVERRGGVSYFCREAKLYHLFYTGGYISLGEFAFIVLIRFFSRICPNVVRSFVYQIFLR